MDESKKIILELTLDELKTLDKHIEYNEETWGICDKIKVAYPQPRMNLQQEGEYAVVSFNDKVYYRLQGDVTFSWYIKKGVNVGYPVPTLMMVNDPETERLMEGLYYNHIQVKKEKEKEQQTKKPAEESEENEWKSVALRFGEELVSIGPCGYYGFTAGKWLEWALNECKKEEQEVKPSMTNCVITGNPPDGYVTWQEWYNELGSKGILHNLRISSIEQSLKDAFVKVQQTEKWKEIQKLIDEKDNDKNFKNSLDLIKEWGENNKPKSLYQICMEWWNEVFVNEMDDDICIDVLISKIDKEFIPPVHDTNDYQWNKCLKMMRDKLRDT